MTVTPALLLQVYGNTAADESLWAPAIEATCAKYAINQPLRLAAFLAQIGHESGCLRYVREIWGPTPAQAGYEGRRDLGNTQPGDGIRFKGRGLIQVTGRANYAQISHDLGVDFLADPRLLEQPLWAAMSAGWFWDRHELNHLADGGLFVTITKRINGGINGLADRTALYDRAKHALGVA